LIREAETTILKQTTVFPFFLQLIFESVPASYAAIFFSQSMVLGISVLITTFLYPLQGLCGLLGVLFSNIWAYLLGTDRSSIRNGVFGLNGALVGLATGSFYALNPQLCVLLLLATLFLTLVTIFLDYLFQHYLGLPALSMPFNITVWIIVLSGIALGHLASAQNSPVIVIAIPMSESVTTFLSTFSTILFQSNPLSGLFIIVAVVFYSRIAFTLMAGGLLAASFIHNLLGIDPYSMTIHALGFNYMFTALAIGGVFVIPNTASLFMGLLSSAVAVIITIACDTLFSAPFSPLALPFNITVYIVLYALHHRVHPFRHITLSENSTLSPEKKMRTQHAMLAQWRTPITVALPFYGKWKVTQGVDGAFTHKENWRFAFDFQAVDSAGRFYKGDGLSLQNYYAFGLPVLTSARGKIYSMRNDVPDNLIGTINREDNWGNYIIIEHTPGYYSCTAHLKQGSIKVIPGQEVQKGEIIAACGNSGRSPYPHIHLQFQQLPLIGSPTISFEFSNFIVGDRQYLASGIVKEGLFVRNMIPAPAYSEFFPYALNKAWNFRSIRGDQEGSECWRMELDFYGNPMLVSLPKVTRLSFQISNGTFSVGSVDGNRTTALAVIGSVISAIPCTAEQVTLGWTTNDRIDYRFSSVLKAAVDLLSLLGLNFVMFRRHTIRNGDDEITVHIQSSLQLNIPFLVIPIKELQDTEMILKRKIGLTILKTGGQTIALKQID